jgi:hypothetical protein
MIKGMSKGFSKGVENAMFDPTAFDNMKVVIEGALYDRDIKGDIIIADRNDVINLAKMSRLFDLSFQLQDGISIAKVELHSTLINLAAELLPSVQMEPQAGCSIRLKFLLEQEKEPDYVELKKILSDIWGESRDISLVTHFHPLDGDKKTLTILVVEFGRLITEDQMEDLVNMIDFMITTLKRFDN